MKDMIGVAPPQRSLILVSCSQYMLLYLASRWNSAMTVVEPGVHTRPN